MSTRYNTGNPIESTDVRDMSDNAKNFDEFSVSTQPTFSDRLGVERKTLPSLISQAEQDIYYAVINAGFQPAQFDFVTGGTLVDGERNKAVFNPSPTGDDNWYAWQGAFPKIISPNSIPSTSGGLGDNAWKPVTNNILAPTVMESIRRSYAEAGYNLIGQFGDEGLVANLSTDVVLWGPTGIAYSYGGTLTHEIGVDETPVSDPMWADMSGNLLRNELSLPGGVSIVGGAAREIRTSQYSDFGDALNAALSLNAALVVDNVQNITTTYRKSLAGKNFKILYEGAGVINYTGPQDEATYRVLLTLDGTGIETVITATHINGNKVRGVGAPIVGIVVSNVYAHYEGCYAENLSAVVNTVTAKLHVCHGARYENIPQQLLTQAFPGVYGYGTVPIDCDLVVVFGNRFGYETSPIDRHSVYSTCQADGTGVNREVHIFDNYIRQRDYSSESPLTNNEDAIKLKGTAYGYIHDNHLVGGVSLVCMSLLPGQTMSEIHVSDNSSRTSDRGVKVVTNPTGYTTESIGYLKSSGNHFRYDTQVNGAAIGYLLERVKNVDIIDDNHRLSYPTITGGQVISLLPGSAVRCERLSAKLEYRKFNHVCYGDAAISHVIDAKGHDLPATRIENLTLERTTGRTRLDPVGGVNIKHNPTYFMQSQEYFDYQHLNKWIRCVAANNWVDENGLRVVGNQADRPKSVPAWHKFYEVDQSRVVTWTGSTWVTGSVTFSGLPVADTTANINAIDKNLLGYGHMIYNTTTKKPAFFDALERAWKYADGATI